MTKGNTKTKTDLDTGVIDSSPSGLNNTTNCEFFFYEKEKKRKRKIKIKYHKAK